MYRIEEVCKAGRVGLLLVVEGGEEDGEGGGRGSS